MEKKDHSIFSEALSLCASRSNIVVTGLFPSMANNGQKETSSLSIERLKIECDTAYCPMGALLTPEEGGIYFE
jgi:hypothetical protein